MLSSPRAPSNYKGKINKRRKAYEEGWKNEGQGNGCTKIAPSYIHTPKCGLPSLQLPLYHGMWLRAFLDAQLCSIIISHDTCHMTNVPWTCHSLIGWNHLKGSLITSFLNLETIVHSKAHYGRGCHYEVPIWFHTCKLICSVTLMICCIERWGDTLDLKQDCRWVFILGFGLPIWGPSPQEGHIGIYRVCVESHGPPL